MSIKSCILMLNGFMDHVVNHRSKNKFFVQIHINVRAVIFFLTALSVFFIPFTGCHQHKDIRNQTTRGSGSPPLLVPAWFASLPNSSSCLLTYAYSGIYKDNSLKDSAMRENAGINLSKCHHIIIDVRIAEDQTSAQGLSASCIKEDGWQELTPDLKVKAKVLNEHRMENGFIAIVTDCDEALPSESMNNELVDISSDGLPTWVASPPVSPGKVYGVGASQRFSSHGLSWQEAERQARADLAVQISLEQSSLSKDVAMIDGTVFKRISETKAEATLRNVKIIRHAYSRINNTYYALACMALPAPR